MWDALIDDPFGRPTRMPLYVDYLFVHGVVGRRKWLVQPESRMARVLGSKVRGAVVFATFPLYLVPSHSQLGLFLAEPPFVSTFVAPLSCLLLGFCSLGWNGSRNNNESSISANFRCWMALCWDFFKISQGGSEFGNI